MFTRYDYTEDELRTILKSIVIIIDTREKANSHITDYFNKHGIKYIERKLECGDYSFYVPANPELGILRNITFENEVAIERKNSAEELSSCFTRTRQRFKDEFLRGCNIKKYLIVENCTYEDIANGKYKSHCNSNAYLGSIHSFDHKYDLRINFLPTNRCTAIFIYGTFYYYLKNLFD